MIEKLIADIRHHIDTYEESKTIAVLISHNFFTKIMKNRGIKKYKILMELRRRGIKVSKTHLLIRKSK